MPPQPLTTPAPRSGLGAALVTRLLVPLWLLVIAGFQIAIGTNDALPVWLTGLALRFDIAPLTMLRGVIWLELATAAVILFFPRWARRIAIAALVAICFSALASISASMGAAGGAAQSIMLAGAALAVSVTLLAIILRSAPHRAESTLSMQWQVITTIAVLAASGVIAGQLPLRAVEPAARGVASGGTRGAAPPTDVVEMDFAAFLNEPMSATPLARRFGQLTARTLEDRRIVVFYNPDCGSCHDLFKAHFAGPLETPVLAIKVPLPPNADRLPSDQPPEVDCPDCEFLDLPVGPLYLGTPPMIVITENGIITCVADQRTAEECLGAAK